MSARGLLPLGLAGLIAAALAGLPAETLEGWWQLALALAVGLAVLGLPACAALAQRGIARLSGQPRQAQRVVIRISRRR